MSEQTVTTEAPRPWRRAIAWMVLVLGPGFFLVYGGCNWLTSLRTDVGSFFFEWERHVPVLPWTIIPYWSLDVFYAFSVLLCRNRLELDRHALRVATLPPLHLDPFDRLLVCQALVEELPFVTADTQLAAYGAPVIDAAR